MKAGRGDQDRWKDLLDPFRYKCPKSDLHRGQQEVREGEEMAEQERTSPPGRCTLCCAALFCLECRDNSWPCMLPCLALTGRAASELVSAALARLGRAASLPAKVLGSEYVSLSLLITPSSQICISSLEGSIPLYIEKTLIPNTIFFSILPSWWFSR